jgi:phytoene dehydrogenase-like protein
MVGSGPNGLAAAVRLAQAGAAVLVLEARDQIGGRHAHRRADPARVPARPVLGGAPAGHPVALVPQLPLAEHGLRWIQRRPRSLTRWMMVRPVLLRTSLDDTAAGLDAPDARPYRRLLQPFLRAPTACSLTPWPPLGIPKHPDPDVALRPQGDAIGGGAGPAFRGPRARALLAGCAAHAILPSSGHSPPPIGLVFLVAGHVEAWPVPAGGSQAISGFAGRGCCGRWAGRSRPARWCARWPICHLRACTCSTPARRSWRPSLSRSCPWATCAGCGATFYGPGTFKLDLALDGPIPWRDPRCLEASTVHIGGTLEEVAAAEAAVWRGEHPERPFVMLCQQSQFDPTRAPAGKHTGYAYCHVPPGSTVDLTNVIERQIERFAPGFRERILARHVTTTADFERDNPNYVGGAITGGAAHFAQLFTRPVARLDPYTTPNRRILICSASTPPGGGVHGMCGYHAAGTALKRLRSCRQSPGVAPALTVRQFCDTLAT